MVGNLLAQVAEGGNETLTEDLIKNVGAVTIEGQLSLLVAYAVSYSTAFAGATDTACIHARFTRYFDTY